MSCVNNGTHVHLIMSTLYTDCTMLYVQGFNISIVPVKHICIHGEVLGRIPGEVLIQPSQDYPIISDTMGPLPIFLCNFLGATYDEFNNQHYSKHRYTHQAGECSYFIDVFCGTSEKIRRPPPELLELAFPQATSGSIWGGGMKISLDILYKNTFKQ